MNWSRSRPKNKYGNQEKISTDGRSFQSKAEAALYQEIKFRELGGECRLINAQDHVYLTDARILYIADFKIWDTKLGAHVWEEMKGFATDTWRIKRRLWQHYGPGILRVYGHNRGGVILTEEIRVRAHPSDEDEHGK